MRVCPTTVGGPVGLFSRTMNVTWELSTPSVTPEMTATVSDRSSGSQTSALRLREKSFTQSLPFAFPTGIYQPPRPRFASMVLDFSLPIFTTYSSVTFAIDHRIMKIGLPVRSAVLKHYAGRPVVGWVTTSESLLLIVFDFWWMWGFCFHFFILTGIWFAKQYQDGTQVGNKQSRN